MLPQEEIDRIETVPNVRGRSFVMKEAQLWYERMGKFAEWVDDNGWSYGEMGDYWINDYDSRKALTTPELINEFLNLK